MISGVPEDQMYLDDVRPKVDKELKEAVLKELGEPNVQKNNQAKDSGRGESLEVDQEGDSDGIDPLVLGDALAEES